MYQWSKTSRERMQGVHPKLLSVCDKALSYGIMDITVLPDGGVRTPQRQQELVNKGVSKTLKSKHLIQKSGYGEAIDLAPFPVDWKDTERFEELAKLMKKSAQELGVVIEWGGDWHSLIDMPHFQMGENK